MIITDIPLLRKKNEIVKSEEVLGIISKLQSTLTGSLAPGVGLAAPQIGINKKVAIVRLVTDNIQEYIDLVNPKIIDKYGPFINKKEACLSFPGLSFDTERYEEIVVIDDLHPAGFVAKGLVATVIQHEIDHVESILITDRVIGKNKIGRNDLCPCGSKIKFKRCHGK